METTATEPYVADDGSGVHMPSDAAIREASWRTLLVGIPKRLLALAGKMIGIKMLILYGATALLIVGKLPPWAWLSVAGFAIGGREMMKYLKDVRK